MGRRTKTVTGKATAVAGAKTDVATGPSAVAGSVRSPNGVVADLAVHAESLAATVRSELPRLSTAKVTEADAVALDQGAARLRGVEKAWVAAQVAAAPGTVSKARAALLAGRNLVFGGLRAFAEDAAAKRELKRIGVVENDNDLDSDAESLVALARRCAGDLAGTEVTPAAVNAMESDLAAFRAARAGAAADSPTRAAVTATAAQAAVERNAAYWSMLEIDQRVCRRGRFRFREDAPRRAGFASFTTERRRGVKKASATKRKATKAKTPAP